jgi:hypothetical protein
MERYERYVNQFVAAMGDRLPWPAHILTDPTKFPTVFGDATDFREQMRTGCHMNRTRFLVCTEDGAEGASTIGRYSGADGRSRVIRTKRRVAAEVSAGFREVGDGSGCTAGYGT